MKLRSSLFSFLSLLVVFVLMGSGCRFSRSSHSSDPAAPAAGDDIFGRLRPDEGGTADSGGRRDAARASCDNIFYPIRDGYTVTYRTTFPPVGGVSEGGYTVSITNVERNRAVLHAIFPSTSAGQPPITSDQTFICNPGGGITGAGFVDMGNRVPGGSRSANLYHTVVDQASGELLPANVAPGVSWFTKYDVIITPLTVSENSPIREPITMPVKIERRALRQERVTVPGGSFDAMVVESKMYMDGALAMQGTEWWGRDAGLVKSVFSAGGGDITTVATQVTVPR